VLRIRRGKDLVEIHFVDGMIVHVYSNYRGKQDLIGEILVKAKLISDEQLDRVLKIQKRHPQVSGRDPGGTPTLDQRGCVEGDYHPGL
jgi:hypothetical protein